MTTRDDDRGGPTDRDVLRDPNLRGSLAGLGLAEQLEADHRAERRR